jgi:prepilin peptidase CpaA
MRAVHLLPVAAAALMLAAAVWHDVRSHRIPNTVVLAGLLVAAGLSLVPSGGSVAKCLGGMAAGFAIFLPLYAIHVLGAGDVKLMAAVGGFVGFPDILAAALYAAVAGGVVALLWATRAGELRQALRNVRTGLVVGAGDLAAGTLPRLDSMPAVPARAPYAIAIAAGTAVHAWLVNT